MGFQRMAFKDINCYKQTQYRITKINSYKVFACLINIRLSIIIHIYIVRGWRVCGGGGGHAVYYTMFY